MIIAPAEHAINPTKKGKKSIHKTNATNEMITSATTRQNSQMTWANWQASALATCYKQIHRRKNTLFKQCSFDWHRWLVALCHNLRCAISMLLLHALLVCCTGISHIECWIWETFLYSMWETTVQSMQKHIESTLMANLKNWNNTTNHLCQPKSHCFNVFCLWWWSCLQHVTRVLGCQLTYIRRIIWLFCRIVSRDEWTKRKPRHFFVDIFRRSKKAC